MMSSLDESMHHRATSSTNNNPGVLHESSTINDIRIYVNLLESRILELEKSVRYFASNIPKIHHAEAYSIMVDEAAAQENRRIAELLTSNGLNLSGIPAYNKTAESNHMQHDRLSAADTDSVFGGGVESIFGGETARENNIIREGDRPSSVVELLTETKHQATSAEVAKFFSVVVNFLVKIYLRVQKQQKQLKLSGIVATTSGGVSSPSKIILKPKTEATIAEEHASSDGLMTSSSSHAEMRYRALEKAASGVNITPPPIVAGGAMSTSNNLNITNNVNSFGKTETSTRERANVPPGTNRAPAFVFNDPVPNHNFAAAPATSSVRSSNTTSFASPANDHINMRDHYGGSNNGTAFGANNVNPASVGGGVFNQPPAYNSNLARVGQPSLVAENKPVSTSNSFDDFASPDSTKKNNNSGGGDNFTSNINSTTSSDHIIGPEGRIIQLGRGSWAQAYKTSDGGKKAALAMLYRTGIVSEKELQDDLTVVANEHIDECVAIGSHMLRMQPLDMWIGNAKAAGNYFEHELTKLYTRKFGGKTS